MTRVESRPAAAVVMSVHRPDLALLSRQVDSLLSQEDVVLRVIVVFDGIETAADAGIRAVFADSRIRTIVTAGKAGIRESFVTGLREALASAHGGKEYYAFADQDDQWHPQKLSRSIRELETSYAALVHCDARVVGEDGPVIAASLHRYEKRHDAHTLFETILLNTVTGMTAVFTAETAHRAVRLCEALHSVVLHDHVTAIAAASAGSIKRLDVPLVDYIQHGANMMGAKARYRRTWWWPAVSPARRESYRQASVNLFRDRRSIVQNLALEETPLGTLAEMFLVRKNTGKWRLLRLYGATAIGLCLRGQRQRAALSMRMLYGALNELRDV